MAFIFFFINPMCVSRTPSIPISYCARIQQEISFQIPNIGCPKYQPMKRKKKTQQCDFLLVE